MKNSKQINTHTPKKKEKKKKKKKKKRKKKKKKEEGRVSTLQIDYY